MVLAYSLKHLKHFRVLFFRQKIYLEIEMIPLIRLDIAAILAHEYEQRKKYRFPRDNRGQKLERKWIERKLALRSAIEPEPKEEPDRVKHEEPHFPRVRGDGIAHAGRKGSARQRAMFQCGYSLNIAGSRRGRLHSSMLSQERNLSARGVVKRQRIGRHAPSQHSMIWTVIARRAVLAFAHGAAGIPHPPECQASVTLDAMPTHLNDIEPFAGHGFHGYRKIASTRPTSMAC